MAGQQQYSLRWNDYTSYITGAFDALRYEEDLVDVTLCCEGRKIRAHKVLLSACSSYFKDIFKENPCRHPVIIFKNVKYGDLLSLVEFMYQGEVSVSQDALPSFLHTAELLSIRGLADNNNEPHHPVIPDQPTSALAQQILQTQSQTMASAAAITTAEPVYFTLPSNSSIVPQIKVEPQAPTTTTATIQPAQPDYKFINKITLKPSEMANALAVQVQHVQQVQQVQQVPQVQQTQQPQQQQQQLVVQQQTQKIMIKPVQPVAAANVVQRTVVQSQTAQNQSNQSATALQALVDSVVSVERTKKPKARLAKPKVELSPSPTKQQAGGSGSTSGEKPTTNYNALGTATTSAQTANNGMGLYEQTPQGHEQQGAGFVDSVENNDVKLQMTDYISVGESINPTSGDSGTYTQPEGYELADEGIDDRQDADEHMGQNSFEMEIVDMDGIFQEQTSEQQQQEQQDAKPEIFECGPRNEDKRFKCKLCDKSFATWKSLAMHRHIHSGRTKCTICGAVLSRTANLKRHMKLKHEP